mgnify:CR=1 FL=1
MVLCAGLPCRMSQITDNLNGKLAYIPCYMQCGFNLQTLLREMNLFVLFFCGWKIKI